MEKEENEKMKALARYGKEFGGYRMIDVPKPTCGPEDIIIEIKAAAICGADIPGPHRPGAGGPRT